MGRSAWPVPPGLATVHEEPCQSSTGTASFPCPLDWLQEAFSGRMPSVAERHDGSGTPFQQLGCDLDAYPGGRASRVAFISTCRRQNSSVHLHMRCGPELVLMPTSDHIAACSPLASLFGAGYT